MPACSGCGEQKEKSSFSAAQLRKRAKRRCNDCVIESDRSERKEEKERLERKEKEKLERERELERNREIEPRRAIYETDEERREREKVSRCFQSPPAPPPLLPLSATPMKRASALVKIAVTKVLERGLPANVGVDGYGQEEMFARLWEVMNNEHMMWLTWPLMRGLAQRDYIDERVHFIDAVEPLSILTWVSQYQYLRAQRNYCGADDMVALVLRAGAAVNLQASNGTTPIFFAMKYSSARVVEMLLDAGSDVNQKDCYGNTIWTNAVERPNPGIIEVLIKRCDGIIPVGDVHFNTINPRTGAAHGHTICDHMIGLYSGRFTCSDGMSSIPLSWQVLGVASVEDIGTSLIRVMQAGAKFSSSDSDQGNVLSFVTHIDSNIVNAPRVKQQVGLIRLLRDLVYGNWLPETIVHEVRNAGQQTEAPNITCPICLTEIGSSDNPVTLYCGHRFCLHCIKSYGERPISLPLVPANVTITMEFDTKETDRRCPICRRLLCGDLLAKEFNALYRLNKMRLGIDRHEATEHVRGRQGSHLLSDDQLRFECNVIINKTEGTRHELIEELQDSMATNQIADAECTLGNNRVPISYGDARVELSVSSPIIGGGDHPFLIIAPMNGPVVMPIELKGVPILASLSPNSIFTVVPQSVVDSFGLKTKPLRSSQFVSVDGGHVSISGVIDEFRLFLDGVEICLNNAIILEKQIHFMRSVQLGMDFFASAIWTRCSVTYAKDVSVITDGGYTKNTFVPGERDELRYYSRDGKICQVPFIHVSNWDETNPIPIVSLPEDIDSTLFAECQWCCRCFPGDGMLRCSDLGETRFYCDEECKSRGMTIHTGTGDV
ncbi:hypothetical protein ACHAWF_010147 [Thalassiosira exigua]